MTPNRRGTFDFAAKRRREIVLHARHVGAADTEDFPRWLIAWVWHNRRAKDQIWSVMDCARNMGGEITEAEASAVTEEAPITRKHLSADNLAGFLGVTYDQRQRLALTTIGSVNIKKHARKELRKRNDRLYQEQRRRERGARPHSESLSRTKPWEAMNMSRRTWERHQNKARDPNDAKTSAAIFLSSDDEFATPERKRLPSEASPRRKQATAVLQTADTPAVDELASFEALPVELRLMALGLPVPKTPMMRRAA